MLARSLSTEPTIIAKTGLTEQQSDSGIESGDQPPSSSSGTSQRSSPSDGSDNSAKGLKQSAPAANIINASKKNIEPPKPVS